MQTTRPPPTGPTVPPMYDYFDVNGWSAGSVPFNQRRGYSTYGVRTPHGNLSGRATFAGQVQGEIWNADNPAWNTQTWLRGTLHLEANLDDGEIAGQIQRAPNPPPWRFWIPSPGGRQRDRHRQHPNRRRPVRCRLGRRGPPTWTPRPGETIRRVLGHNPRTSSTVRRRRKSAAPPPAPPPC